MFLKHTFTVVEIRQNITKAVIFRYSLLFDKSQNGWSCKKHHFIHWARRWFRHLQTVRICLVPFNNTKHSIRVNKLLDLLLIKNERERSEYCNPSILPWATYTGSVLLYFTSIQFNSIYFKTHNIKKASNTNTNNTSHGTNEIQLRNMFWKGVDMKWNTYMCLPGLPMRTLIIKMISGKS